MSKSHRKAKGKSGLGFTEEQRSAESEERCVALSVAQVIPGIRYVVEMSRSTEFWRRRWITISIMNGFKRHRRLHIDSAALAGVIEGLSEAQRMLTGPVKEFSVDDIAF